MKKSIVLLMLVISFGAFAAEEEGKEIPSKYSYGMYEKDISKLISLTAAMRKN